MKDMNSSFKNSFSTFLALTNRDLKVFSQELADTIIDGIILIITEVLMFGYLLPLMGMPKEDIAPMYIGSIIFLLFFLGENLSLKHVFDLKHARYIDYQLTLPFSYHWLFFHYIVSFIIETIIISLPLLIFGIWLLGSNFALLSINWFAALYMYLISLIFFSIFFLYLSFAYSFEWFMDNVWPRILSPLYGFGCTVFYWKQVKAISPFLSFLCLLNPLTYISEGIRSALLGDPKFIPAPLCFFILLFFTFFIYLGLQKGINQQLDPVS